MYPPRNIPVGDLSLIDDRRTDWEVWGSGSELLDCFAGVEPCDDVDLSLLRDFFVKPSSWDVFRVVETELDLIVCSFCAICVAENDNCLQPSLAAWICSSSCLSVSLKSSLFCCFWVASLFTWLNFSLAASIFCCSCLVISSMFIFSDCFSWFALCRGPLSTVIAKS